MPPNKLSYESAALAIGVGVVLFTALLTINGKPGLLLSQKQVADLGEHTAMAVTSDDKNFALDSSDVAPFLASVGIIDAANLAELVVDYGGVQIKGGQKLSADEDGEMLSNEPTVRWMSDEDTSSTAGRMEHPYVSVVMFDPDAPSRAGDGSGPGASGPWLHALWTGCDGDTASGESVVEYNPPTPPTGTGEHRYIFVQFKQKKKKDGDDFKVELGSKERSKWDLKGFVESNAEVLTPAGVSFFVASPAA